MGNVTIDQRRELIVPGDYDETIHYAFRHWIDTAQRSIKARGSFHVALSGGGTPKAIFQKFRKNQLDWSRVFLYWSDERCVPPDNGESNYKMAMDSGLATLGIPESQIFRMKGELPPEEAALQYDKICPTPLDLVMLGMGDDGHTASLFPKTHGLHPVKRTAIANFLPQKDIWRLTLTFDAINAARHVAVYVLGESKADMLQKVLFGKEEPDLYPAQRIGTSQNPALWIADKKAARLFN